MNTGIVGRGLLDTIRVKWLLEFALTPPHEVSRERIIWLPECAIVINGEELVPASQANAEFTTQNWQGNWFGFDLLPGRRLELIVPTRYGVILVRRWPDAKRSGGLTLLPDLELFFSTPSGSPEREMLLWAYLAKHDGVELTEVSENESPVIAGHSLHKLLSVELAVAA